MNAKSKDPYEAYRTVLYKWEGMCIICGEPFENMESITKEHLVLRSKGGRGTENLAPSHFMCNQVRSDLPLIQAMVLMRAKKVRMGEAAFKRWCNKPVPHRRPSKVAKRLLEEKNRENCK